MTDIESLTREVEPLREVCYQAYQLAGALGANEESLDNLLAAAEGKLLPHERFLPTRGEWDWKECGHIAEVACAECPRLTRGSKEAST
jgi:hypothetical protein